MKYELTNDGDGKQQYLNHYESIPRRHNDIYHIFVSITPEVNFYECTFRLNVCVKRLAHSKNVHTMHAETTLKTMFLLIFDRRTMATSKPCVDYAKILERYDFGREIGTGLPDCGNYAG